MRHGESRGEAIPRARAVAAAWLAHPLSVAGIVVLLLNDHLLKGLYGSWWTGKLSDVAGLVFAPALVAVLVALARPRTSPRVVALIAVATVGILFAAAKSSGAGAAIASDLWPSFGGPGLVRADATDLLALPALTLSWFAFRRALRRPASAAPSRRLRALLLIPAAFAVSATSNAADEPADAHVASQGGRVLLGFETSAGTDWAASTDGRRFEWITPTGTPYERQRDCVPSQPLVCYRVAEAVVGVEISDDGGATWSPEWGRASDPTVADDPSGRRRSTALAVIESGATYRVFVANGYDGFAIRDGDGNWHAVGYRNALAAIALIQPPPSAAPSTAGARALAAGVVIALYALIGLAVLARGADYEMTVAGVLAVPVVGLGAFLAVQVLLWGAGPEPPGTWNRLADEMEASSDLFTARALMAVAAALILAGLPVAARIPARRWLTVAGWSALAGIAGGLARLVPLPTGAGTAVRGAVIAIPVCAVLVAAFIAVRRTRAHGGTP